MSTKWFSREDGYTERDLLQSGLDHLQSASALFQLAPHLGPWCLDSAGYLCQLGFELLFKAILLDAEGRFPGVHSLGDLASRVRSAGIELDFSPDQMDLLRVLSRFYELRYPNPKNAVSISTEHFDRIADLEDAVVSVLTDDLKRTLASLHSPDDEGLFRKGNRIAMIKPLGSHESEEESE